MDFSSHVFGWAMIFCGVIFGFGLVAAAYRWALRLFVFGNLIGWTTACYVFLRVATVEDMRKIPFALDLHPILFAQLLGLVAGVLAGVISIPGLMVYYIDELRREVKAIKSQFDTDRQ